MAGTLHRPRVDGSTSRDVDIQLEPEQQRRRGPGRERSWIVAAVAVTFVLAALVLTLLLTPGSTTAPSAGEPIPEEPPILTPEPPADEPFGCDLVRAYVPC